MIKGFLKDALKYLPAQVTPAIVGFISIPIVTRIFPPQEYGNYSIAMATIMVLTTIVGWIPMSIIRFYPIYEKEDKTEFFFNIVLALTFISVIFISIISLIGLFIIKKFISSNLYFLLFIGIGVFFCVSFFSVFQCFLRTKRQINWYSGFAVWKSIGALVLGLGLIFIFKLGIEGLLWGIVLSILIILPLLWKKTSGEIYLNFLKLKAGLIKKMAVYSFPLVIGNLAAWILSLSDRYILEAYRGSQEVGIYSASYNISEKSILLITSLFMLASGPILIHIWEKEGWTKSKEFLYKVTRYYLIICIPAVVGLGVLSRPLIMLMTGKQYSEGYIIFPFVTFGVLFLGLQQRFNESLLLYKKTNYIAISIVSAGLLNLLLNFIFIPEFGYFAAAVTTFVSYVFLLFLMIVLSRRYFIWKFPFKSLIRVTVASGIMGTVVFLLGKILTSSIILNLLCSIVIGIIVYFVLLYILREFNAEEKNMVFIWIKKNVFFLLKIGKTID